MPDAYSKNFDLGAIQQIIGYRFKNWELLFTAFTHASYANEFHVSSYERLEFLGDSLVNLVIAHEVYERFEKKDEGFLTRARAAVVSRKTLCIAAEKMGLLPYLRFFPETGDAAKYNQGGDVFEAVAGAIFLDGGFAPCAQFIRTHLEKYIESDQELETADAKSTLLEYAAKNGANILFETELQPDKSFRSTVLMNGMPAGAGFGGTKKKAEQYAARTALDKMQI